ncbi:4-(cytidine 5'-diphospho)-2-C-methyl-D-erythritol kinase [Lipingzhangella sp. LS1_29]|uniref:4-diphosphocytidyl-2-C-methyl-D-erythritol kinase n=1 Tax=Lipingzhangella rawalii TaxID=2055835 RepID=A0ABU2H4Y8_9ACTN|nr:4-(cytidine 5'-diphospho)-2-C-methyl-D-erythritol kinase [Lipingzhangella rawalii]MDS1270373.1 4-(cytidine 5'-diphospho)-2-C-methyl-D-erythritol kinase [Lipingzhangella rawalii]
MTAATTVTVRVPAKVNLQLAVGPAREDGYHELVNVFHAVSLYDEVTVRRPDSAARVSGISLSGATGSDVPQDSTNLAARAAELLAHRIGYRGGVDLGDLVDLRIHKAIPVAGGMAGGSADAAAALLACATLWNTGHTVSELAPLAAELGSDVPFALMGHTAVGRSRGEQLTPLTCTVTLHWVFALAHGGLSTAEVYRAYDRIRPQAPEPELSHALTRALEAGDAAAVGQALHNDLQPAALDLRPELARTLQAGADAGALGGIVSGSGPTCAFLARDGEHARELAAELEWSGTCLRTVCAHGPVPGATRTQG